MASVQRAEFELGGLFKFHCVSLCGRLYPLPRRATFRFRNALHLIEARNSVAYVRGIWAVARNRLPSKQSLGSYPKAFGQAARFKTSKPGAAKSQTQRGPPHSLSHTTQHPFHWSSAGISGSVRVTPQGTNGLPDRSLHFATSAFLSIAFARHQSS